MFLTTSNDNIHALRFYQKLGWRIVAVYPGASAETLARTREALHNSWDKNDPKDAQVILHLLRNGNTQYFYDPVIEQTNDLQELSKTHDGSRSVATPPEEASRLRACSPRAIEAATSSGAIP